MNSPRSRSTTGVPEELPAGARRFVIDHVGSVAELEALLLLRQRSVEPWTANQLARRLYIPEAAALRVLDALYTKGFVTRADDGFRFAPARDELRLGLDAVAQAYPRFLIPITQLIHDRQRSATRHFSDAFRLRDKR